MQENQNVSSNARLENLVTGLEAVLGRVTDIDVALNGGPPVSGFGRVAVKKEMPFHYAAVFIAAISDGEDLLRMISDCLNRIEKALA